MKPTTQTETAKQRLEYLRGELRAERISLDGLHELQSLREHIAPGDVELLEAAGVPETCGIHGPTCPASAERDTLREALEYIANKCRTLAGWKLDPSGHDVNIAELGEIEERARLAINREGQWFAPCQSERVRDAAPELLSALRHVQTAMMSWQKNPEIRKAFNATCNECSFSCAAETIEAAIARATGGEI